MVILSRTTSAEPQRSSNIIYQTFQICFINPRQSGIIKEQDEHILHSEDGLMGNQIIYKGCPKCALEILHVNSHVLF